MNNGKHCFKCGKKGFTILTCPKCDISQVDDDATVHTIKSEKRGINQKQNLDEIATKIKELNR